MATGIFPKTSGTAKVDSRNQGILNASALFPSLVILIPLAHVE
jgi:hypothetical protein